MKRWQDIREKGLQLLEKAASAEEIEKIKVELLGKRGEIQALMLQMKDLDPSERPIFGKEVNELKSFFEEEVSKRLKDMIDKEIEESLKKDVIDISLPAMHALRGNLHPMSYVLHEVEDIFVSMGYEVVEGPEVELDLYNFERANIPADHPARDMQDTFFVDVQRLLRTHTTAIQTRVLEDRAEQLPIKVICPGKTYRRDDDDATHSHQFTQVEGIVVGENITLADLKGTLELLAKKMFGENRVIRLRPSYFQFTEPSVEIDVTCMNCNGKGCTMCKQTGWIEILGAGMVHPNVLEMAGIDSKKYSGFAFGVGIERVAILKYGIDDIRSFYTNDIRFLNMFTRFE